MPIGTMGQRTALTIDEQRLVAAQRIRVDFDAAMRAYKEALDTTSRIKKELTKAREDEDVAEKHVNALSKLLSAMQESYGDLEGDILSNPDTGEMLAVVVQEKPNESGGSG